MKKIWMPILIIVAMLSGCYQKGTVMQTGLYEPYRIADTNIPFADKLHMSQFDRVMELEEDNYGRRYFSYKTYSVMLGSEIEIHIISQMTRDDKVFYYPDKCYLIRMEEGAAFTDEDVAHLKMCNDWNLPLAEDRMYTTSYSQYQKDIAYEETVDSVISAYLALDDSYGVLHNGLELLSSNAQLFFVTVFPRNKAAGESKFYLMVYEIGSPRGIAMCQQVDTTLNVQNQVFSFRETWSSGRGYQAVAE